MNKLKVLAIGVGVYLAMAVGVQHGLGADRREEQLTKRITVRARPSAKQQAEAKFAGYPEQVIAKYCAILTHVQKRNANYVSQARRGSPSLEDAIKKYGLGRIVDIGNKAHTSCLELAMERIDCEMSAGEFDRRTEEIARDYYGNTQKVNVSAPIDFTREIVIQASQQKVIVDALFYERLLRSNPGTKATADYEELVESAFSREEYSEQISKQLTAIDGIYDALLKSRVGFRGLFATSGINRSREFRKQYCKEQAEKTYSSKRVAKGLARKGEKSSTGVRTAGEKVSLTVVVPHQQVTVK